MTLRADLPPGGSKGGEQPAVAPKSEASAATILVVDDEEANRDSLARRLARRGFSVSTAVDGPSALNHVRSSPPDLILLDVMMPGMSGIDVLKTLRLQHSASTLPVIMATARSESDDLVSAFAAGANDYVTKPLDFPVVLARVQTQVALLHAARQVQTLQQRVQDRNADLESANAELLAAAERGRREMDLAAKVQESFLPPRHLRVPGLSLAWAFIPCSGLAGDALNVCPLGANKVGLYVLDVAGHGVAASLTSVAATRALSAGSLGETLLTSADGTTVPPAEVATRLDRLFPFNRTTQQFLTFFYCVLDLDARNLTYVSAGHPGAILMHPDSTPDLLDQSCTPIGLGEAFEQHTVPFSDGDRLYLYSDGIPEAADANGEQFRVDRLVECLVGLSRVPLQQSVDSVVQELERWRGDRPPADDITLLAAEFARKA